MREDRGIPGPERHVLLAIVLVAVSALAIPAGRAVNEGPSLAPSTPGLDRAAGVPDVRSAVPSAPITVPIGSDLADLALDPIRSYAYLADRLNNRILVVALDNGTVMKAIGTEPWPFALAIDPSASTLYVGHAANFSILAIDLSTLAVRGEIPTGFLTAALVAPTDDTLVATVHDTGWDYPYVLNATDGTVLQRLGLAANQNYPTYQDSLIALSPDRTRLFLADTEVYPTTMKAFARDPGSRTWTLTALSPGGGHLGDVARDLAGSPDDRYVYLATLSNSVLRVDAATLAYAGTIGPFTVSTAVVVSANGARIALSAYDSEAHVFDAGGAVLGNLTLGARVERMRVTADGARLVATVGEGIQDLEIVLATAVEPIRPTGLTSAIPDVEARIVTFEDHANYQATMDLDGVRVNASFDVAAGILYWTPLGLVSEGLHDVVVHALRFGVEAASAGWTFTLDRTPPTLLLDAIPTRTGTDTIVVSGTVIDAHLASMTVDGTAIALAPDGRFSHPVALSVGQNRIPLEAKDAAGLVTVRSVGVYFDLARYPYVDGAAHFGIGVPDGWHILTNGSGLAPAAALLRNLDGTASIGIAPDLRGTQGTFEEARAILLETLAAIAGSGGGLTVLEPIHARTVDGHAAAGVFGRTTSGTLTFHESLVVVLAPEWGAVFVLSGTVVVSASDVLSPYVNETLATFDVLPGPPPGLLDALRSAAPALRLIGEIATVIEATILGALVLRGRRRPAGT